MPLLVRLDGHEASATTARDLWKHADVGALGSGYKETMRVQDVFIRVGVVGASANAVRAQWICFSFDLMNENVMRDGHSLPFFAEARASRAETDRTRPQTSSR